ncbi:helix-turn-helix domain-containing protein [Empedobacter brevis]|uniref:helix-turn-helix domain-containing protein n=1 Tax=Empedobacter brevis TaxID=247 RepID=UPI0039AEC70B
MAKENIYQSLEVFYEKVDECPLRDRQYNFFEMIYVISGTGYHAVNGNRFAYFQGDLFLLAPNDCHEFDVNGICEFMVIRFGEQYINHHQFKNRGHISCLLYYTSHLAGSIILNADDKIMVASLINNLRMIIEHQSLYVEELIHHLVNAIIVIVAKNIAIINPKEISLTTDIRLMQILDYIQTNICKPEVLKISVIAEKFGFSPNYLGHYFRKQCNESIQQYISSCRIRLIEHRLRFSDKRVHEIADEFGFTDESHINKFFKRYHGVSLKKYKMNLQ